MKNKFIKALILVAFALLVGCGTSNKSITSTDIDDTKATNVKSKIIDITINEDNTLKISEYWELNIDDNPTSEYFNRASQLVVDKSISSYIYSSATYIDEDGHEINQEVSPINYSDAFTIKYNTTLDNKKLKSILLEYLVKPTSEHINNNEWLYIDGLGNIENDENTVINLNHDGLIKVEMYEEHENGLIDFSKPFILIKG